MGDKLSDRRRLHKLQLFYKMENHLAPYYLCNLLPLTLGKSLRTHFVTQIIIPKSIRGLHFMEAHFSIQQYVSGINSQLNIEMQNHKIYLKHLSLILKIKYHITTTVVIALNKCYINDFVQNAAHFKLLPTST